MAAVRAKDTVPELLLRRELHRRGLRYRLHARGLVGKPDLVFASARIAVFVDGDFWHGQGWRERGFANVEAQFAHHRDPQFWIAKIRRNMARDDEVNTALAAAGWRVVRVLESQVRADVVAIADSVEAELRAARSSKRS
jgi:DNA mismatch endonuclease (patch repair protein)